MEGREANDGDTGTIAWISMVFCSSRLAPVWYEGIKETEGLGDSISSG